MRVWTQRSIDIARELHSKGWTIRDIAMYIGRSPSAVSDMIKHVKKSSWMRI